MSDTQIKSVALFFFFVFFDEQKAIDLTSRTLRLVRKKSKGSELNHEALIIKMAQKICVKEAAKSEAAPPPQTFQLFQIPDTVQLGFMHAVRKRIALDEYSCLVWTKIIGTSENILAAGLGSTLGTIRHRNGNALKTLGQLILQSGDERGL